MMNEPQDKDQQDPNLDNDESSDEVESTEHEDDDLQNNSETLDFGNIGAYKDTAKLEEELKQAKEQMMRAMAEAENIRKRAIKEREDAAQYSISAFAKDLLDFSDNFRRAIASVPEELKESDDRIGNLITGIAAMEKELLNVFDKHGITKIEPMGEIFDPNFHEVMFEVPAPGSPAGTIMEIMDPGYILKGRLLRPARVGVAKDEDGSAGRIDQEV